MAKKKLRKMPRLRKRPRVKRVSKLPILIITVIGVIAIVYALSRPEVIQNLNVPGSPGPTGLPGPVVSNWNCGDLQIDINSMKEASSYTKFGIDKPAPSDYKYEVLSFTVTNKGSVTKDFSGYRLDLVADSTKFIPVTFSNIEKISLVGGSSIDYACNESKIASVYRLVLDPGESETGCKIFQVLEDLVPASMNLYNLTVSQCSVKL